MEFLVRFIQVIITLVFAIAYPLWQIFMPRKRNIMIPPIRNNLLNVPLVDVVEQMRTGKLKPSTIVRAYIDRIIEVNPLLNAVADECFDEAWREACNADIIIANAIRNRKVDMLFKYHPLMGAPVTVKECCGVKGLSFTMGSQARRNILCPQDSDVVTDLKAAGAIILLVTVNPEFCYSIETNTLVHGKCLNPYDIRRTAGGSSGGEGALNGVGATLFGIGTDLAGSIRIPALFNGVFGHKPTGGLLKIRGILPECTNPDYKFMLQPGPITRFGCDLELITRTLAAENASKLDLERDIPMEEIKIFFSLGFTGLNGLLHQSVSHDMKFAILKAVTHFRRLGLRTEQVKIHGMRDSLEIALSSVVRLTQLPFVLNSSNPYKLIENVHEYVRSMRGDSPYTKDGLMFELMRRANAFMNKESLVKYKVRGQHLKTEIMDLLGDNGVLFFPTFHVPAVHHNTSHLSLWGIDYALLFSALGLPATQMPIALDDSGLPVGFQVIAAPFKDKLCFQIAEEVDRTFGWKPPTVHFDFMAPHMYNIRT